MVLPLLAIGLGVAAGASKIAGGIMQSKSAAIQAQQAKIEGEMARLRGVQIAEQSRINLTQALGNISAITAARGLRGDDATGQAIRAQTKQDIYRNEAVARLAELNRAGAADATAAGYRMQSAWAIPMATLDAFKTGATTYAGARAL